MAKIQDIPVPDIGDFDEVDVVEVLVGVGDRVAEEDSLITLESDKASMEVPAPQAGIVRELKVSPGDKIGPGAVILTLEIEDTEDTAGESAAVPEVAVAEPSPAPKPSPPAAAPSPEPAPTPVDEAAFAQAHASPAIRRYARELGVDLGKVEGSGRKGRILKEDVQSFVKKAVADRPSAGSGAGFSLPEMPDIDFSKFGEIEIQPLSRIQRLSGANLSRAWITVPHVTQFDEADITEMEAFRKAHKDQAAALGLKLTPVAFLLKAVARALLDFPTFNASLSADRESLVLKKYVNIGVAVDTPKGLIVPVIRDVGSKGLFDLGKELGEVSARARDGKLTPRDLSGGCFSISSLGGIGGTAFTPIVNAPEVAILGVSRSSMKPIWQGGEFVPRLMLPLSLSYDHRVIDGASAARFVVHLSGLLSDLRRLLL